MRKIDRSTLVFVGARRTPHGVDVSANFEAPKATEGTGSYKIQFMINPKDRSVRSASFVLRNRADGGFVIQSFSSMSMQRALAQEIRDVFLTTPAWQILKDRPPDLRYVIDALGNEISQRSKSQSSPI
jgi:hypothetical protein